MSDGSTSQRPRPEIQVTTELHEAVDAAVLALGADPDIFQRDGELVRVTRAELSEEGRGIIVDAPTIRAVSLPTIREILSRCARFTRWDARAKEPRPITPPDNVCAAVLARGEWTGVRPLSMVTETPCMRPDGSILDRAGYDAPTGILYLPSACFLPVPRAPSQADAMNALRRLTALVQDFPFASESHRYVHVAAILTMLARSAIKGAVPAMLVDASTRGSGKTLLSNLIAIVTTGRGASLQTYPADEVEFEKLLGAFALFGARLITLDNLAGVFGCGPLDKCLTAEDRVSLRILGKSEIRELPWLALIIGSGNNIALGADTARRCLVARLEPDTERPEERAGFAIPNLLAHARAHRTELVRDALTILRAFVVAGRPGTFTWGSFQSWASLVAGSIAFAGGANVLEARATTSGQEEPEVDAIRAILTGLPKLSAQPVTAKQLIHLLYDDDRLKGRPSAPDMHDDLREALEYFAPFKPVQGPDAKRLGNALRKFKGRIVGGARLVTGPARSGVVSWVVQAAGAP